MLKRAPAGSLERAVLTALWDGGDWLTPWQVLDKVDTPRPIGYATVTTVLVRLWRKGRVSRQKAGHSYAYRARETREEHVASRMDEILAAASDRRAALAHFVEVLSDEDKAEIRRTLGGR